MRELQDLPHGCTLGLSYTGLHDSAIAIVGPDGDLLFACALERLTRHKQDGRWPTALLEQVPWDRIEYVGLPTLGFEDAKRLGRESSTDGWPHPVEDGVAVVAPFPEEWNVLVSTIQKPLLWFDHHHCHAASGWFLSGFTTGLVLTCDGGAHQSPWFATAWRAEGQRLRLAGGMHHGTYHSPARLYVLVTALLGLRPNRHEGKVTGLAARGKATPERMARFEAIVWPMVRDLGSLLRWIPFPAPSLPAHLAVNEHLRREWRQRLEAFSDQDLAACVQAVAERSALDMVAVAKRLAGDDLQDVCLAGGFFANVRVNQRIFESGFRRGFVAPPMTDDGNAVGAALLARLEAHPDRPQSRARTSMFLGPGIESDDAALLLERHGITFSRPTGLAATVAEHLAAGKTVALARGRMEFGPRALGHRSVLCAANESSVNDWLNHKLARTEYMPFAPITLEDEAADSYFPMPTDSIGFHFMTVTTNCTEAMKSKCPAVVHVDGTARPQLVAKDDDAFVDAVLREYRRRTGVGTMLNTSFNMHEEPIVCTAADAVSGFARAELDFLCLGDLLVQRTGNEAALRSWLEQRTPPAGKSEQVEKLALSCWVTHAQRRAEALGHRVAHLVHEAEGLRHESGTLRHEAGTLRHEAANLGRELAERDRCVEDLRARLATLRQQSGDLTRELVDFRTSITFQALRAFDDLRRGDVRRFATKVRGFVLNRGGGLARRVLSGLKGEPSHERKEIRKRPSGPSPSLPALRARVAALLPPNPPLVSAMIPCFNYGGLVGESVGSLLAQTYPNVEIIVVDDGSTDPVTIETLAALESERVKVLRQQNAGLVGARNNAAKLARGSLFLFLDNDDLLDPDAISLLFLQLQNARGAAFAYPDQRFFGDQSRVAELQEYNAFDLLWFNHCTVSSLISREAFERIGGYMAGVHGWEDWDHWLSLAEAGDRGVRLPVPVFAYRRHGRTMGHDSDAMAAVLREKLVAKHPRLYEPGAIAALKRRWRPLISAIVVESRGEELRGTIAALDRQSLQDFEVVVVRTSPTRNGSSTDLSVEGLVVVDRNDDASPANLGARRAKGDYLFFVDPKLELMPTALEQLAWTALSIPSSGFVQGSVGKPGAKNRSAPARASRGSEARACLLRRTVYLEAGGLDHHVPEGRQWSDFWSRLASSRIHGTVLPDALTCSLSAATASSEAASARLVVGLAEPAALVEGLSDDVAAVIRGFTQRYANDLAGVPFEPYTRGNAPGPFHERHWADGRIHILYLIPYMTTGGAERVDLDLLEGIDHNRYHVTLAVEQIGDNSWQERFEACVEEVFVLPRFLPEQGRMAFLEYLLMSRNVDLVFNRNTTIGYRAIAAWRTRFPEIRCVDLLHSHTHSFEEDWVQASAPYHQSLDRRFVVTQELRDYSVSNFALDGSSFRVIHCGVDIDHWNRSNVKQGALRRTIGVGDDVPLVGFVGRLTEEKDPLLWVRVAGKLAELVPASRFVMIGDGHLAAKVKTAAAAAGLDKRFFALGHRDDVRDLMGCFDVLLLTSQIEGLPIVVLEAMSLGIPTVAPDIGGIRECVTADLGALVPAGSGPDVFARAVASILQDPQDKALRSARRIASIREHFTLSRMRKEYRLQFEELLVGIDRDKRLRTYITSLMARPLP